MDLDSRSNWNWRDFSVEAAHEIQRNRIAIRISRENPDGSMDYAKPIEFANMPEDERYNRFSSRSDNELLSMPIEIAEQLMNRLWQLGLRPSKLVKQESALAATQDHLKDMRTIVWKGLDLPEEKK